MPTLDWIGKRAVVNQHREVPYRLIHCDGELSAGDADAGNLLVQGDNLEALKALLPYYAGKVKCIYIDPPYNTGNEGWVYNDNVASPEIKAWLGKVVGKEAEDLSRHDKWLCMMYPRLRLLREFLREDGVIFVSIDDTELATLRLLMEEIFGARNFVAQFSRATGTRMGSGSRGVARELDYLLCFANSGVSLKRLPMSERDLAIYNLEDSRGRYLLRTLRRTGGENRREDRPSMFFPVSAPDGTQVYPIAPEGWESRWSCSEATYRQLLNDDEIVWKHTKDGWKVYQKFYVHGSMKEVSDLWNDVAGNKQATRAVSSVFGGQKVFDTPKPVDLISRLVSLATDPDDLILDSFAGSGTTGHAVLDLNKQDGGNRRFILVEMEEAIAPDITAERLRRVIDGYDKGGDPEKPVEGLGGGFRYCRLGSPLFNEFGDIDGGVIFPDLAAHVFFSETGSPLPKKVDGSTPFIGTHKEKAVYLLFSPAEQGFAREASGNVLTPDALAKLPAPSNDFEGVRVVYAEGCTVSSERLKAEGVIFKQIPYQIEGN